MPVAISGDRDHKAWSLEQHLLRQPLSFPVFEQGDSPPIFPGRPAKSDTAATATATSGGSGVDGQPSGAADLFRGYFR